MDVNIVISEGIEKEITGTEIDGAYTVNYKTLTDNLVITGFTNMVAGKAVIVEIENEAGDSYTVDWPDTIDWGSQGEPVQRIGGANGAKDIYSFVQIRGTIQGAVRQ